MSDMDETMPDRNELGDEAERIVRRLGEELSSFAESLPEQIAGAIERVRSDVSTVGRCDPLEIDRSNDYLAINRPV
jgi:hypothetical protein